MILENFFNRCYTIVASRGKNQFLDNKGDVQSTHSLLTFLYLMGAINFITYFAQVFYVGLIWVSLFELFGVGVFLVSFYFQKYRTRWGFVHASLLVIHVNMFLFSYYLNLRELVYLYSGVMIITIVRILFVKSGWMIVHLSLLVGLQILSFFISTNSVVFPEEFVLGVFYSHVVFTSVLYIIAMVLVMRVWSVKASSLEREIDQKEVLLAEVNHRVRNNLNVIVSLINLQKNSVQSEESIMILEKTKSRVYAMAEVHNKLYVSAEEIVVDLNDYTKELLEYLCFSYGRDVDIKIESNGLNLYYEQLIPLGLILNELTTNSLKHAFDTSHSPEICVVFEREDDIMKVLYSDNGKGFEREEALAEDEEKIGLGLIDLLSEQLGADVTLNCDDGVKYLLAFKRSREE